MAKRDLGALSGLFAVPELIETSCREAGVDDPGLIDTPGLAALCDGLRDAADQVHFIGRNRAQRMLVETLVKRLRVANHLAREPAIAAAPVHAPIFLVGPFRTGTTLLHRLLARDPAHRTPRLWEALQAPPLEPEYRGSREYFAKDYRVGVARRYIDAREKYTPALAAIHASDVDLPEECFGLLETSLLSHSYMFYAPVVSYLEWLDGVGTDEWRDAYQLYAEQLQLLQWWWPAQHWVLKSPFHMWAMDSLCEQFPDALIVQQHRDPQACLASFCSLMAAAYAPICVQVDKMQIGRIAMHYLRDALARNVAARAAHSDERFIDIDYPELVADPIACVSRIYAAAGRELPDATQRDLRAWHDRQSAGRKGKKHEYDLADYGVDRDEVREAFAAYDSVL